MSMWLKEAGGRLSDLIWAAYEHSPQLLVDAAVNIPPFQRLITDRRVPVNLFHGAIKGGRRASLLAAGAGASIEYMLGRFFAQPPTCESIGNVSLLSLPQTLRDRRNSADITIAEVPRLLSQRLAGAEYVYVPPWVGAQLRTPQDPELFARGSQRIWEELRPARHNNLRPQISYEISDFDCFYHEMYLPYAQSRFGKSLAVRPFRQLRRLLRHGGALMWIYKGEQRIAGALFWQRGGRMGLVSLGLAGAGDTARKAGAISALYYFGIEYSKAQGCTMIDFGGCRPSPGDGVTWYKRKWNVNLVQRGPGQVSTDLLFRWERPNDGVRAFLSHTPLIIREGQELSLIAAPDDKDPVRARRLLWMEGLKRMYVLGDAESGYPMPGLCLFEPETPQTASEDIALLSAAPVTKPTWT